MLAALRSRMPFQWVKQKVQWYAAAAGQQDSLPPVIVCVTQLTLVVIQVDQVVGGEGKAVDVRNFQLVFVFHHPVVRPVQKSCDRGRGRISGKEADENVCSPSPFTAISTSGTSSKSRRLYAWTIGPPATRVASLWLRTKLAMRWSSSRKKAMERIPTTSG
jgi:hypothetical protein